MALVGGWHSAPILDSAALQLHAIQSTQNKITTRYQRSLSQNYVPQKIILQVLVSVKQLMPK